MESCRFKLLVVGSRAHRRTWFSDEEKIRLSVMNVLSWAGEGVVKRVVLVEDEKLVLLGIESLFEAHARYTVVASYTRALPALQGIGETDPDLIITDIKMPGMDGLTFLERLRDMHVRAKVVILSCLEDFSIVSKAFKLGAVDYILKHELDEAELFRILDGITIESPENAAEAAEQSWNTYRRFSDRVAEHEDVASDIANPLVCLMVCKKKYTESHLPIDAGVDTMWLLRFVHGLLATHRLVHAYPQEPEGLVLVLDADHKRQEERNRFFRQLTRQLQQYINSPVVILRTSDEGSRTVQEQWRLLADAKESVFHVDSTKVVMIGEHQGGQPPFEAVLPDPIWLLQGDRFNQWEQGMDAYFIHAREHRADPSRVCMELIVHWHQVEQHLKALQVHAADTEKRRATLFEHLKDFDDLSQLRLWYLQELPARIRHVHQLHGHSRKVMMVKLYLLEHYAAHITLQDMARLCNMNSTYLCELFKRESRIGFVEYLNTIRLQQAKSLLLATDATVEDVSQRVGFVSASHFSRLFKRMVGQTVSDFRAGHGCSPNM